jgi:hypothetical protein
MRPFILLITILLPISTFTAPPASSPLHFFCHYHFSAHSFVKCEMVSFKLLLVATVASVFAVPAHTLGSDCGKYNVILEYVAIVHMQSSI